MKKRITRNQFEHMIAECVREVLSESCQKQQKPSRKAMNEAQMQHYIQNIINEELENEAFGWAKDAWNAMRNGNSFKTERGYRQNQEANNMINNANQQQEQLNNVRNAINMLEKNESYQAIIQMFPKISNYVENAKQQLDKQSEKFNSQYEKGEKLMNKANANGQAAYDADQRKQQRKQNAKNFVNSFGNNAATNS